MSKRLSIVLLTALVVIPCTTLVGWAEEPQAESPQAGSEVETDCKGSCCKDGECKSGCCKDGECAKGDCKSGDCKGICCKDDCSKGGECKYTNCNNPNCDTANCTCNGCNEAGCKNTNVACTSCNEAGCRAKEGVLTNNGKWCPNGCAECSGVHTGYCWKNNEPSIFGFSGQSLFSSTSPRSSTVSDAVWQQVASELEETQRQGCRFVGEPRQAKETSVYLVIENQGGDLAIETKCDPDATVSSVLHNAVLPRPVNFADAEISVNRGHLSVTNENGTMEAEEAVLPVQWDETTGEPTKCTDHALKPNDRVCIRFTPSTETAADAVAEACSAPKPVVARAVALAAQSGDVSNGTPTQIQYNIQIIEDCSGCMSEYEALKEGMPMMVAESKTLLPAMRMLAKHDLIERLSSPKLICTAGETAELEIGSDDEESSDSLRLGVSGRKLDSGLAVELAMHASEGNRQFKVRTAVAVEEGQTIVLKANAEPGPHDEPSEGNPAVYLVVTPEVVK